MLVLAQLHVDPRQEARAEHLVGGDQASSSSGRIERRSSARRGSATAANSAGRPARSGARPAAARRRRPWPPAAPSPFQLPKRASSAALTSASGTIADDEDLAPCPAGSTPGGRRRRSSRVSARHRADRRRRRRASRRDWLAPYSSGGSVRLAEAGRLGQLVRRCWRRAGARSRSTSSARRPACATTSANRSSAPAEVGLGAADAPDRCDRPSCRCRCSRPAARAPRRSAVESGWSVPSSSSASIRRLGAELAGGIGRDAGVEAHHARWVTGTAVRWA